MDLFGVMRESLRLLLREPKMFLPNLTVAVFYALFELLLLKMSIDLFGGSLTQENIRAIAGSNMSILLGIIAFYPLLAAMDLISYAMYPSMVSDHYHGRDISLGRAMGSALKAWRIWISVGLVIAAFVVLMTPVVSVFFILHYMTGNPIYFALGTAVFLLAVITLLLAIFFVMPIGVIEKERTLESFRKSYALSRQNKKEVTVLVLLSFAIMAVAFLVGSNDAVSSNRGLTLLAAAAFIAIKMLQSTMYTYVSVINPYLYLNIRHSSEEKKAHHAEQAHKNRHEKK